LLTVSRLLTILPISGTL